MTLTSKPDRTEACLSGQGAPYTVRSTLGAGQGNKPWGSGEVVIPAGRETHNTSKHLVLVLTVVFVLSFVDCLACRHAISPGIYRRVFLFLTEDR